MLAFLSACLSQACVLQALLPRARGWVVVPRHNEGTEGRGTPGGSRSGGLPWGWWSAGGASTRGTEVCGPRPHGAVSAEPHWMTPSEAEAWAPPLAWQGASCRRL